MGNCKHCGRRVELGGLAIGNFTYLGYLFHDGCFRIVYAKKKGSC
jgi:hypothetical protein